MPNHKHCPSDSSQDTTIAKSTALPFLFLARPLPLERRLSLDQCKKDLDFGTERTRYLKAKSVRANTPKAGELTLGQIDLWAALS